MPESPEIELLRSLIANYIVVRQKREKLEPEFKRLEEQEDKLAFAIHDKMTQLEIPSIKLDRYGTFIRSTRGPYCSIKKQEGEIIDEFNEDSREAFEKFTESIGMKDQFIRPMPIWARVNSYVGAALKDGRPVPPGLEHRFVRGVTWTQRNKEKRSG